MPFRRWRIMTIRHLVERVVYPLGRALDWIRNDPRHVGTNNDALNNTRVALIEQWQDYLADFFVGAVDNNGDPQTLEMLSPVSSFLSYCHCR